MTQRESQSRQTGRWAAAALLLLAASPALGAAAAPAAATASVPTEEPLDPVRLLTVGFAQAELEEGESLGEHPPKFQVVATMKPFRLSSGRRVTTDHAELEMSFVPSQPVGLHDRFVNHPMRVYGHLRVFDDSGATERWGLEPANFADWSPHVTYDRQQSRVTIVAPVALVDAARTHRVPILLVLNCRPAGGQLDCYKAPASSNRCARSSAARPKSPSTRWGCTGRRGRRAAAEDNSNDSMLPARRVVLARTPTRAFERLILAGCRRGGGLYYNV